MTANTNGDALSRRVNAHLDTPVLDPTALTTQQLLRELATLREIIETRLDGGDKAVKLLQDSADKIPFFVAEAIGHLKELHEEKFESIQTQFQERDVRGVQAATGSKTAVDTAFSAQKEATAAALQAAKEAGSEQNRSNTLAISKSEAATIKQIEGIGTLIAATSRAVDDKIEAIKERLDRGEGTTSGVKETKEGHKSWIAVAVSIAAVALVLILGILPYIIAQGR